MGWGRRRKEERGKWTGLVVDASSSFTSLFGPWVMKSSHWNKDVEMFVGGEKNWLGFLVFMFGLTFGIIIYMTSGRFSGGSFGFCAGSVLQLF